MKKNKNRVKDLLMQCDEWSGAEGVLPKIVANGKEKIIKAITEKVVKEKDGIKKIVAHKDKDISLCLCFLSKKHLQKYLGDKQSMAALQKEFLPNDNSQTIMVERELWRTLLLWDSWDQKKYQLIAQINTGISRAKTIIDWYGSDEASKKKAEKYIFNAECFLWSLKIMDIPAESYINSYLLLQSTKEYTNIEGTYGDTDIFLGQNIIDSRYNKDNNLFCYVVDRNKYENVKQRAMKKLSNEIDLINVLSAKIKKSEEMAPVRAVLDIDRYILNILSTHAVNKSHKSIDFEYVEGIVEKRQRYPFEDIEDPFIEDNRHDFWYIVLNYFALNNKMFA